MSNDSVFMRRAIELALLAETDGNLPIGSVISLDGEIIAEGRNTMFVPKFNGTRHAEIEALQMVPAELWRSAHRVSLYTTLEPCVMCFGSILLHGVSRVLFGSSDRYGGAGTILSTLPPFFRDRFAATEWLGPTMPLECDPLFERAPALFKSKMSLDEDS